MKNVFENVFGVKVTTMPTDIESVYVHNNMCRIEVSFKYFIFNEARGFKEIFKDYEPSWFELDSACQEWGPIYVIHEIDATYFEWDKDRDEYYLRGYIFDVVPFEELPKNAQDLAAWHRSILLDISEAEAAKELAEHNCLFRTNGELIGHGVYC